MPSGENRAQMGFIGRIGPSLASDSTRKRPIPAGILALGRTSLRQCRLAGGVRSQDRTLLRLKFPDKQGKYRELSRNQGGLAGAVTRISPFFRDFLIEFPARRNREFLERNREMIRAIREVGVSVDFSQACF